MASTCSHGGYWIWPRGRVLESKVPFEDPTLVATSPTGESRIVLREKTYGRVGIGVSVMLESDARGARDLLADRECIRATSGSEDVVEVGDDD